MNRVLWIAQWLLAVVFLFAGISKLLAPLPQLAAQVGLPAGLLLFVSWMEVLGGLGMILPGLLKIRTGLTALAALGLVIIMVGATTITLRTAPLTLTLLPFSTGLVAAFVAFGRWRLVPLKGKVPESGRVAAV